MLIIFKSKAGSDVIYLGEHGKAMLKLLGKDPEEKRGVVTVEQLPEAIAKFKAVIDADKAQAKETERLEEANVEPGKVAAPLPVNLFQRAVPLLNLLEHSLREKATVTWGV